MRLRLFAAMAASAWAVGASELPRSAPPLQFTTFEGRKLSLADYRGKVILLKFFLTDCAHCQRTTGAIMPIYREWRARGLEVVGIAINADARQRIPEFIRRFGVTYPIAIGDRSMVTTFADVSAVTRFYVPYLFMIDRQGQIRYQHPGEDQAFFNNEVNNLRVELDTLLKQPAAARKGAPKPAAKAASPSF